MIIRIISVGKVKESYFTEGIHEELKGIRTKLPIEIIEVKDEKTPDKAGLILENQIKIKEGNRILDKIRDRDYVIALCIEGKQLNSKQLKRLLDDCRQRDEEVVDFVIGGSLGLDERVVNRADYKLSFSAMTFPHQMMRLILVEQLQRIF